MYFTKPNLPNLGQIWHFIAQFKVLKTIHCQKQYQMIPEFQARSPLPQKQDILLSLTEFRRNQPTRKSDSMVIAVNSSGSEQLAIKNDLIQKYQMEERISQLQNCKDYKERLKQTCKSNRLPLSLLNGLTLKRLKAFYVRTLKHYESNPNKAKQTWFENQLRLFHWVLLIESFNLNLPLSQFNSQHWKIVQTFFPPKDIRLFEFEAKKLLGTDPATYSRSWLPQECELLCKIMKDKSLLNKWNDVARNFYEMSEKCFFRTSKQCREQWFNHLDNSKKHGEWTDDEDWAILDFVMRNGRKWAQLCKDVLPHRTEHMIKNRFKSLVFRGRERLSDKTLNEKKVIRKLLSKVKVEASKAESRISIKKMTTYQSSKAKEQEGQEGDSFFSANQPSLGHDVNNNQDNIQQIIDQGEQSQQNERSQNGHLQGISFSPADIQPEINVSLTENFQAYSTLAMPQIYTQSMPFFTNNPFYPTFVTFLHQGPIYLPFEGNGTLSSLGETRCKIEP